MPSDNLRKAQQERQALYKFAKANNLNVRWKMKTSQMKKAVDAFKGTKVNAIVGALKKAKNVIDKKTLSDINRTTGSVEMTLGRFKRIRKDIVSPADRKLLLHFKNSSGVVERTFHLNDRIRNVDDLFLSEENQYVSGADVELYVIPTTRIEIEWLENPKRSRSERKNFFRYLTKAYYNLEAFQVYEEYFLEESYHSRGYDPEKDSDLDAINYPCFLFALLKGGVDVKIVKQISQTMFNYGATVDFIRKTAKAFNLCISVKQFRVNRETGRANNDTTMYGDRSNTLVRLGSVGEHLFAILPTNITKAALDNPELVARHNRTDFIVKSGCVRFKSQRIKFLDSYEVISYLYHHRETHLQTITQRSMPFLLNNKYQEVRSLSESDFHDSNFREMGRVKGKELKLGQAPFKQLDAKTKKYEDVKKFNVIYFDIETLVKGGKVHPYCVSYCIAAVDMTDVGFVVPDFSETKNIYGFGCIVRFLESLPEKSHNLLWAYNSGFDCRFPLKDMTFSSRGSNIIDSGTKVKQLHGYFKGREIIIKDAMSFLSGGLSRLPNMFKGATGSISLEKECFPHDHVDENNFQSQWPLKYLKAFEDKETLIANAMKIGAVRNGMFDCQKYAIHYCNRDVDVLRSCFEAFRKLVYGEFKLDVYRYLSVSSLAMSFQHNEGCFDGCFEVNSVLLGFLREASVGGRVMTRDNKKHHIKNDLINNLSTNSKREFISYLGKYNAAIDGGIISFIDRFECSNIDDFNTMRNETLEYIKKNNLDNAERLITLIADFDAVSLYPSAMAELPGYARGKAKLFKGSIPSDADYYVARVRFDSIGKDRHFPLLSYYDKGSRNFTNDLVGRTMIVGKQALEDIAEFQEATYTVIEGLYWNEGFNDQITKTITKMFSARLRFKAEGNPLQEVFKLMMNSSYGKLLMKPIIKQKVIVSGGKAKIDAYTRKHIHKMISRTPINDNLALFEEHKSLTQHFSAVHLGVQILDSSKHIMNRVMTLAEDIDAKIWYQDTDSMHIDFDAVPRLATAYKQKYNKELIGKQMGQFHTDFQLEGSEGEIYAKESIFLGKKSYLDLLACEGNDVEGFHIRMKGIPGKLLLESTYETYMKLYHSEAHKFELSELCPIAINTKTQEVFKRTKFERIVQFK